ncbi:neural-cadherin-like isoform X3 [Anopheles albimanus]|uniref:neural-cadherin-like isoform X3 n=1 Tax=Anopheles albimanus TaxID=7167 RepID=UPI00163E9FFE|nr:neural-cadherin-like isoform X3 [Anopheles albimanus]XP_035781929.1 neural-cadherin-like isoform X3 [Anopheles albimanus]
MVDPLKIFWVLTNSTYLVTKFIKTGIADKNDYPLYFEKVIYEADIDENVELNHNFLNVTAKTHGEASGVRYKISSGNIGNVFAIRNATGALYVAKALDYEKIKKYELRLTASDNFKENYTTVLINVRDVNDNPPVFEKSSYRTQITEEDDRGLPKRVLRVTASDADVERPNNIIYFLTGPGIDIENPSESNFDINKATGEIFVLKPLNRDPPHGRASWKFTVFAQDEGGEGLVGFTEVQINLKDVNDNAPLFPNGIAYGNVTENGTIGMHVMTIKAEDYDDPNEGTNAKVIYSIEKNAIEEDTGLPIFDINPDTGVITTAVCCLDREKTPDYSLQIVATDGGGLKGTGTASIRVKDLNDMPPRFTKDEWFVEVEETDGNTLPEAPILTVTVNDDDEINNFQYKIIESSGYGADKFAMVKNADGTGSLKVVQPLDYEDPMQINGFRFRIQVIDNEGIDESDKYHVDHSWVIVKLMDINDNTPRFKKPHIEAAVYENAEIGKTLGTFKAVDIDKGGKSRITYGINRATDRKRQFAISPEGTVTIQRELDRETMAKHSLEILAADDGVPPRTASAILTVLVKDVNDNAPEFAEDYRPILLENSPPSKIIEIAAIDRDDPLKGNGPPFQFRLDPDADDIIRTSFKVEQNNKGDGMAIISSLSSFDREYRKQYSIPIVIKDSGTPPQTGTSTLTITIGDLNDNIMQPGSKEVIVYNYQGQAPDTPIGRVFVNDLDDWDTSDKLFYWDEAENPRFKLDDTSGMVTMRRGAREGRYRLRFKIYDRKHAQESYANMSVQVKHISYEAIVNSGSVRLAGITDEDFIRVWNYRTQNIFRSRLERFRDKLAELLHVDIKQVDVFSVQMRDKAVPLTDVRFAVRGAYYYKAVQLNGIILLHKEEIEQDVGINITMVNVDECLLENADCAGSCTSIIEVQTNPCLVNANKTALVGVQINSTAECVCSSREYKQQQTCKSHPCLNGGRCTDSKSGIRCSCPPGYTGPRCQQVVRSFRGNGWAWYSPLDMCDKSHISVEIITTKAEGLVFYNGPITPPKEDESSKQLSDFIALELEQGYPRFLIDYGSGTLELRIQTKHPLNDGEWHRIDLFWDTEQVKMVVDFCKTAEISEADDGKLVEFVDHTCQAIGRVPQFNEYLNLNTPLQIGGLYRDKFDYTFNRWQHLPSGVGFEGCIREFKHNGILYDLSHPGLSQGSAPGCLYTQEVCDLNPQVARCLEHGRCVGSYDEAKCECNPGWTGTYCSMPTTPTTFKMHSYVKYALSFEPDKFTTQIQLRFRTREQHGELFRISDQHMREYGIIELKGARVYFRYSLNTGQVEEQEVALTAVEVDDGQWHVVKVQRYGSAAILELDGGEGANFNQSFSFDGHQWLSVDKQEGVFAGGKPEFTGVKTYDVKSDYQKSCIDDIRLDGKSLPLPPATNGTQWGQATTAKNIERYCSSNNPCQNAYCPDPFECVDLWNKYECACGDGMIISPEGKTCIDRNECLEYPCLNGGTCINQEPRLKYKCICPDSYWGESCEFLKERQALKFSTSALAAVIACLLLIIILLFVYFSCSRRRSANFNKKPATKDDIRENIINYCDEGGGENDMTAFDMKTLKIPIGPLPELVQHKAPPVQTLPSCPTRSSVRWTCSWTTGGDASTSTQPPDRSTICATTPTKVVGVPLAR